MLFFEVLLIGDEEDGDALGFEELFLVGSRVEGLTSRELKKTFFILSIDEAAEILDEPDEEDSDAVEGLGDMVRC